MNLYFELFGPNPPGIRVPRPARTSAFHVVPASASAFHLMGYMAADELSDEFEQLADEWRDETASWSSPTQIATHPAYQQIIGMGAPALPLILDELEANGGPWHWALAAISKANPVTTEMQGRTRLIDQAWLEWGKQQGYID